MRFRYGWLIAGSCGLIPGCMKPDEAPAARTDTAVAVTPASPATWVVGADRVGPVRIGATVAELESTLGTRLARADSLDPRCDYLRAPEVVPGVWFMVIEGRVARFDIDSAGPPTAEGARVGDSAEKVSGLYAPRVAVTPHKYTEGQYLTVSPAAAADSLYRIIFETDGSRITRYRAGRLPEVGWVESCS